MEFPSKSTGVGCHSLPPGDLPDPGYKPGSPALQTDSLPSETPGKPYQRNPFLCFIITIIIIIIIVVKVT